MAEGRKRPAGFTILGALLGITTPVSAVMLMRTELHPGLTGAAFRLLDVSVLASAAVLAIGLWRCERWVGTMVVAWAALLAMATVLDRIYILSHARSPALTLVLTVMTVLSAIPLAAVVWYVRRRTRDLWSTP